MVQKAIKSAIKPESATHFFFFLLASHVSTHKTLFFHLWSKQQYLRLHFVCFLITPINAEIYFSSSNNTLFRYIC